MMKNTVIIILLLFMGLVSCKKDEVTEPQQSKEDLLCQIWNIDNYSYNGNNLDYMTGFTWEFTKDGNLISIYSATGYSDTTSWQWVDNNENILIESFDKSVLSSIKSEIITLNSSSLIIQSLEQDEITYVEFSR